MKCIYFFLVFSILSIKAFAQTDTLDDFPDFSNEKNVPKDTLDYFSKLIIEKYESKPDIHLRLLDSGAVAICRKDTALAIKYLKEYISSPSNSIYKEIVAYKLGILYTELNKIDSAIITFNVLLRLKKETEYYSTTLNNVCLPFSNHDILSRGGCRYNACLRLSEFALKEKNFREALKYLTFAEKTYPANHGGCGNAYYMYRGQLNQRFADFYLLTGDTAHTIQKSFDCLLNKEGYPLKAVQTLRSILYSKYTNKQIIAQIDKGISGLKRVKHPDGELTELTLFGQKVIWMLAYEGNEAELKQRLREDTCLIDLTKLKYTPPQYYHKN